MENPAAAGRLVIIEGGIQEIRKDFIVWSKMLLFLMCDCWCCPLLCLLPITCDICGAPECLIHQRKATSVRPTGFSPSLIRCVFLTLIPDLKLAYKQIILPYHAERCCIKIPSINYWQIFAYSQQFKWKKKSFHIWFLFANTFICKLVRYFLVSPPIQLL